MNPRFHGPHRYATKLYPELGAAADKVKAIWQGMKDRRISIAKCNAVAEILATHKALADLPKGFGDDTDDRGDYRDLERLICWQGEEEGEVIL